MAKIQDWLAQPYGGVKAPPPIGTRKWDTGTWHVSGGGTKERRLHLELERVVPAKNGKATFDPPIGSGYIITSHPDRCEVWKILHECGAQCAGRCAD